MAALIENRKARFDYEILETFEAGLELRGFEVKALKGGKGSLVGSRIIIRGGEAYAVGLDIPSYQAANIPKDYDSQRTRRLLLNKKEIQYLGGKSQQQGLTLIPLEIYNRKGFLKISLGLCRGLKKYDKREKIKEREEKRKIEKLLKI